MGLVHFFRRFGGWKHTLKHAENNDNIMTEEQTQMI